MEKRSGQSWDDLPAEQKSASGAGQVAAAATVLVDADRIIVSDRLAHVFVSLRLRTRETFELLMASNSALIEGRVTYIEAITEWDYGDYEGCTNQEIREWRKQRGLDTDKIWDIFTDGCEGGESCQEVTERLARLIEQIKEMQRHSTSAGKPADVLVVAHGLILRCFWKLWVGLRVATPLPMKFEPGEIAMLSYKDDAEPAFHLGLPIPGISVPPE